MGAAVPAMTIVAAIPTLALDQVTNIGSAATLFFAFCIGHALADFPLQGEFLARGKNRHLPSPILADGGNPPKRVWIYCLTAHSLIHGGFVWLITGNVVLGLAEFVLHWIIDALKSESGIRNWLSRPIANPMTGAEPMRSCWIASCRAGSTCTSGFFSASTLPLAKSIT